MIIHKWIKYEKEIEISLSAEDICLCFKENEDEENNQAIVLSNMNQVAGFLKGIPDDLINNLGSNLKLTISNFLIEQAQRYKG